MAEDHWWECPFTNWGCLARFLLPNNADGTNQVLDTPNLHEWAASRGYVVGYNNVIEFKLRFDNDSLRTLGTNPLISYPFALEIDIAEAHDGSTLRFDRVESDFPSSSNATQDTPVFNWVNPDSNADGLIVRDASKIEANHDYTVKFYLKDPLPVGGIEVTPSLQISYNTRYFSIAASILNVPLPADMESYSSWNYFPLESDNYATGWKIYPDGHEGVSWTSKATSTPSHNFVRVPTGIVYVSDETLQRYDYYDKVCRAVAPNPAVEQFRNAITGHITIFRTPADQTGYRYANANCNTEGFGVLNDLAGDGTGSGSTSGSESTSKPNLYGLDTFVTYGESSGTQRVTESDHTFLGTSIWCQFRMGNNGHADITRYFDSECRVSVGKKFDGWNDSVSLGLNRTQSLAKGATHTEHKGIDILFYPGWYNVVSKLDVNNVIAEENERDNSYDTNNPFIFQIWGRPSIVTAIETDKTAYLLNEPVRATAWFANTGSHPYGKTAYVDWYVDGAIVGSERDRILRENLHPGVTNKAETATLLLPTQYGEHEIKVCFRFANDDLVEEVNPADNCAVRTVSVPDPNPPIAVTAPIGPAEPIVNSSDAPPQNPEDPNPTPPPGGAPTPSSDDDDDYYFHLLNDD